ncbi:MAG TPA: PEP/pyruvate-binding domain-containing protein [Actinomycetes bacterium]|jgi:phosphoenolpyruvate synthase/pyruvate phosphate dikinase|nr:PEP/pyruvate-binding domain-containing protein [Actinomycetes bacterium]
MRRLVDLGASGDPPGADPSIVGDKAARLARAQGLGLPVLPGRVVGVREAREALRRGAAELGPRGSGAARLAVMDGVLDPGLAEELAEALAELGTPVVVRSSSPLEAGGAWAGAFSSFHDVGPAEVAVAVRGCWASAFSVDVLGRAEAMGVPVGSIALAVLIQPQIDPSAGGTAALGPDGMVTVETVQGPPAALLGGWQRGSRTRVGPDGSVARVEGGPALPEPVGLSWAPVLTEVAAVLRRLHAGTGDDLIEWALVAKGVVLLQARRAGGGGRRARRDGLAEGVQRVRGAPVQGTAAAPGIGAGPALVVPDPHALGGWPAGRGYVVVAPSPLPALAPLLWGAAALVTATGGPGAHLVDVARSLRVPAVVSAPVEDLVGPLVRGGGSPPILVVDGGTGQVSAVQAWAEAGVESPGRG